MLESMLKKQIVIAAPAEAVWDALTNPDKIKVYLFGTQTISDWKKGSSIRFTGTWEGKTYEDRGTILEFEENRKFQYTYWSSFSALPDVPENYSLITFSLEANGSSTGLTLEQSRFASQTAYDHSSENWDKVLAELRKLVE